MLIVVKSYLPFAELLRCKLLIEHIVLDSTAQSELSDSSLRVPSRSVFCSCRRRNGWFSMAPWEGKSFEYCSDESNLSLCCTDIYSLQGRCFSENADSR